MRAARTSVPAVGSWPIFAGRGAAAVLGVAAACSGMVTPAALADVTITSRESSVYAFYEQTHPINPRIFREESATFTDLGPWSVTLPESGYSHADHADTDAIGGVFVAFFFGNNNPIEYTHEGEKARQTVTFFNEAPRPVSIRFSGSVHPWFAGNARVNMKLTLVNTDTGEVVFDIHRDGAGTFGFVSVSYAEQTWTAEIPQGNYEVLALTDDAWRFDSAGHLFTNARVDFTLTFGDRTCPADFNGDGFLDFFDYLDFVNCFETGECGFEGSADFNADGFADFFDYADFVEAFEAGC